jgi:hypothetical protein
MPLLSALPTYRAQIKRLLRRKSGPAEPWWECITGAFEDDPVFEQAMRLGRQYRESQRPRSTGNRGQTSRRLAKKRVAEAALRIRKSHDRTFSDSAELIRKDRDR